MGSHILSDRPKQARWKMNTQITPILQCFIFYPPIWTSLHVVFVSSFSFFCRLYISEVIFTTQSPLSLLHLRVLEPQISVQICAISTLPPNLLDIKILFIEMLKQTHESNWTNAAINVNHMFNVTFFLLLLEFLLSNLRLFLLLIAICFVSRLMLKNFWLPSFTELINDHFAQWNKISIKLIDFEWKNNMWIYVLLFEATWKD